MRLSYPHPAAENPVGALYETLARCCPDSATLLGEGRGECIPPRVTAAGSQQGREKLKPISPSQHFQQELSPWELPCPAGKRIKMSCSEAAGGKNPEGCMAGRWGYTHGVLG